MAEQKRGPGRPRKSPRLLPGTTDKAGTGRFTACGAAGVLHPQPLGHVWVEVMHRRKAGKDKFWTWCTCHTRSFLNNWDHGYGYTLEQVLSIPPVVCADGKVREVELAGLSPGRFAQLSHKKKEES